SKSAPLQKFFRCTMTPPCVFGAFDGLTFRKYKARPFSTTAADSLHCQNKIERTNSGAAGTV
ncbi:MAG: hypothetical protein ACREF9_10810, partial [Opitutaceae bacterium]